MCYMFPQRRHKSLGPAPTQQFAHQSSEGVHAKGWEGGGRRMLCGAQGWGGVRGLARMGPRERGPPQGRGFSGIPASLPPGPYPG